MTRASSTPSRWASRLVAAALLAGGALAWLVRQPAFEFREVVVTDGAARARARPTSRR